MHCTDSCNFSASQNTRLSIAKFHFIGTPNLQYSRVLCMRVRVHVREYRHSSRMEWNQSFPGVK